MSQRGPGNRPLLRPMVRNQSIKNPLRVTDPKKSHLRDKNTIKRLKMYNSRAERKKDGTFISGDFMSRTVDARVKRIQPDRRWFGNTRTVGQKQLEDFREEMKNKVNDPYTFVMRTNKLPMGLLNDKFANARMDLLSTESFQTTYGKKSIRKKPKLPANDLTALMARASQKADEYEPEKDQVDLKNVDTARENEIGFREDRKKPIFTSGQSNRIWTELYKVIDSSDVLVCIYIYLSTSIHFISSHRTLNSHSISMRYLILDKP